MFGLYLYPTAKEIMEKQQDISWFAQEIKVEKDIQDYKVNMDAPSYDLVLITLQLFVEIEQNVGDIWTKIESWFPHSEIEGACSVIASMEKSVHAFFYQKMSDVLNINPEATMKSRSTIVALRDKLEFLNTTLKNASNNKPLTLATVAMIEQVLLFSNFAMLKSFQANGNNLIPNTVSGVDYVINDEVLHGEFAAYLFNTYAAEQDDMNQRDTNIFDDIHIVAEEIIKHEDAVIDHLFETDDIYINGVNSNQLKSFIRHRVNYVFNSIGMEDKYQYLDETIAKWFYKGANAIKMHDFFVKGTNSYSRTWSEDSFTRLGVIK